jgi:beta-galactosidase GanA
MPPHKPTPPYLGAAYYPEAWPLEHVDADIERMLEAGMNVMRMAEFAWQRMEPQEGHYDFDWLHLVVEKLGKAGIATILGTPTPTPPAWLTERYPEVLIVADVAAGVRAQHGARAHACQNNPVYRELGAGIVTRLAEEFGRAPHVIGWQVDNEVYATNCRCPVCVRKFRERLRARYGSIDALNQAWGLGTWSQCFQSFEQIPFPRKDTWHHPSLKHAWSSFQSDSAVEHVLAQVAILRRLTKDQPIGTDMMQWPGVNHFDMNQGLDVVQYNHYDTMQNLWESIFLCDSYRPLKARPFWCTETSTCWNGGTTAGGGYREPGFCRVNSWLPIALGGEANLYWLWRSHSSGQELMHGSVVSSCGRPLHIFGEVQEIARGFRAAAGFLNETRPVGSTVALHLSTRSWEMSWAQPMVQNFSYNRQLLDVYHLLLQLQLRPDVIHPAAALDAYRVIVSPCLTMLDEGGLRERLRTWIEAGGTWVAGPLTDVRTIEASKFTHAPFGTLEEWAGVYCKYDIPADPRGFSMRWADGTESKGSIWHSGFELRGAKALATYTENELAGLAAVTCRRMGKGRVIALGTMLPPEEMMRLLQRLTSEAGIAPVATASTHVLVAPRTGAAEGMVVVEHEHKPGSLTLPRPMTDLLTGKRHEGVVALEPYAVMVLKA